MASLPGLAARIEEMRRLSRLISHSAIVLTASAVLDRELKLLIIAGFQHTNASLENRLFGRSLQSLGAKADIAYAMGIISKNSHDQLLLIADMRNNFAHPGHEIEYTLDTEPVSGKFRKLRVPAGATGDSADVFHACLNALSEEFGKMRMQILDQKKALPKQG